MKIKECTATEIIQHTDFPALRNEYIEECANSGLPRPDEKLEIYKSLTDSGVLHCFVAMQDEKLLGFVVLIISELPHYGRLIATTESLFVGKEYRKSGAGLALIRKAEERAKELKCPALIISVPKGGSLDRLLPRLKYVATNTAYTKGLL